MDEASGEETEHQNETCHHHTIGPGDPDAECLNLRSAEQPYEAVERNDTCAHLCRAEAVDRN